MKKTTQTNKFTLFILALLTCLAILVWLAVFQNQSKNLKVVFCDVGQGDAIFVRSPANFDLLIDGGPDNSVLSCLGESLPFYDRKIELIILTHPQADHLTGLVEVIKRYQVDKILITGIVYETSIYEAFLTEIKNKNIAREFATAGRKFDLGAGSHLFILYPLKSLENVKVDNVNEASIVAKLEYQKVSFLFTGDIEEKAQKELINSSGGQLASLILKIPHHGGSTLAADFLNKVSPRLAIISVGRENKYGHPAQKTLDILTGIKVWRTDQDGTIKIISDGQKYWAK